MHQQAESIRNAPTLLVVDDRPENLTAMEALLEHGAWQVRSAGSGEEALRCLLEDEVELVLLDVQMPEMDGFEVARLMRGTPRNRYTPIIFVSAMAQTQDAVLKGYASGAVDFILKPFDPKVLRHKIQALLLLEQNRRELQRLGEELERSQAFNSSVLANAAEGILVVGEDGVIQFANPAVARMLQGSVADLEGTELIAYLHKEGLPRRWQDSEFYRHWRRSETCRVHDVSLRTFSGGLLPVALSFSPLTNLQRSMVVIVLDMSVERALHAQLESQAITDPLTGLLNRRGFHQALNSLLARVTRSSRQIAVLYLDLDGFKRINDSLGHAAGDQVLQHVAEQVRACLRPYDLLARVGGDEFTALLDSLEHPEFVAKVAEKLIQTISIPHVVDGVEITLGVSIGIACYPECGQDMDGLLRAADMAMYEAKRAGRQQYRFFSEEMNGRARVRLLLEESLRKAIEHEDFQLVYQPQIYLNSGRLRGFEALLRWHHPQNGVVAPGLFIPLLEETRLINQVGELVLRAGARQFMDWPEAFRQDLILSLNVSPVQFALPNLVAELQHIIERYQLRPEQVELEVTESTLMHDMEATRGQLHQLRQLGIRVALDDFGTGYSSLAYLRHFELDTLKIDRVFIANLFNSPRDAAIVRSIIELGRNLGMEVIAEGVETIEQRDWLQAHQCSLMQGFLVAQGLSVEDAGNFPLLLDWSRLPYRP